MNAGCGQATDSALSIGNDRLVVSTSLKFLREVHIYFTIRYPTLPYTGH